MLWTTTPQTFIALGFFIGVDKNVENFVISHVLDQTFSPGCCEPDSILKSLA